MRNALLDAGWRLSVLAMIYVSALLGLALSYRGFCDLVRGAWPDATPPLAVAILAGIGVKWLCVHRGELIEA